MTRILRIILVLVLTVLVLILCSACGAPKYGCGPSKNSRDYAKIISVKRTVTGDYKYVVYTDKGVFDTLRDWKYIPKDSCALVCRR